MYQISRIIFLIVFGTYQSQFRRENRGAADKLFSYQFMKFMETSFLSPATCGFAKIVALEAGKWVGILKKSENKGNTKFKSRKLQERFKIYCSFFEEYSEAFEVNISTFNKRLPPTSNYL